MIFIISLFIHLVWSYQSGDLILQPLKCYSCDLIEAQEKSVYSHMGIIIEKNKEFYVAEALGIVKLTPLKDFILRTEKGQRNLILRHKEFQAQYHHSYVKRKLNEYLGREYDSRFLWDDEKIYCSELVWKVFDELDFTLPKLKKMLFDINPDAWDIYFNYRTPRGEMGISPQDFVNFEAFEKIEEI